MTQEKYIHPTARDQFVNDYTMVVDNDSEAFFEVIDLVRGCDNSTAKISDIMREHYEEAISKALDVLTESEEVEPLVIDIMRELLTGWGSSPFDEIARHYIAKDNESVA